jgi:cobalt-zinc-cadmium efflux system outer membrane protein
VSFPIPLFDQGQARIASAEAQVRRVNELRAAMAVEIRAASRAARARLIAARERVAYLTRVLLPLRARIVDEAQLQYNAMQIGAFPLLDARRIEIETGARFVNELREYWTTRTELERILNGRLGRPSSRTPRPASSEPTENVGH